MRPESKRKKEIIQNAWEKISTTVNFKKMDRQRRTVKMKKQPRNTKSKQMKRKEKNYLKKFRIMIVKIIKNTLEGINHRLSEREEWRSEMEEKMVETTAD